MIDKQGKLFNRVSIIDIAIIIAILALGFGFAYRRAAPHLDEVLRPDETFYVTFEVNRIRSLIVSDAVAVDDVFFRQHGRQPLGRIVDIERLPATEILRRRDGTAMLATMEERYALRITIEATGSINDVGFWANGNDHMAPGAEVQLINSNVFFPLARVYSVSRER